jgi:predicted metal-dependent HD superfamily phosphohydrolase
LACCYLDFAPRGVQNMTELLEQFATLGREYSGPQRHYHNLEHIFHGFYQHRAFLGQMTPVNFFAWMYHDSVYDPLAQDNEEQSADIFEQDNALIGLAAAQSDEVVRLILATKHLDEKNVVTDIDLCGLGLEPGAYDANTARIRREYMCVSDERWNEGRRGFIQRFLAAEHLFFTPAFREAFEGLAKANLGRELAELAPEKQAP